MKKTNKYNPKEELALDMWVKLARAFSTFDKLSGKDILRYGVTQPQFAVLECLGHLGSLTIGGLSKKMLVSGGNMTVVVDNLEKMDFVERIHSSKDRRAIHVQLTVKGKQWFDESFPNHAHHIVDIASVLSTNEQKELSSLLKKLGVGLQNINRQS